MLEYIVLGMVNYEDMTGYDIKKYIENGICIFYKASFGSLYPILKKLTQKEYLVKYEKNIGERNKIYYHITTEGRKAFEEWLEKPISIYDGKGTNLVKVYFYDTLPMEVSENLLMKYKRNNEIYLEELRQLEKQYINSKNQDCYYYKLSVLNYGVRVIKETISWCEDIIQRKEFNT